MVPSCLLFLLQLFSFLFFGLFLANSILTEASKKFLETSTTLGWTLAEKANRFVELTQVAFDFSIVGTDVDLTGATFSFEFLQESLFVF